MAVPGGAADWIHFADGFDAAVRERATSSYNLSVIVVRERVACCISHHAARRGGRNDEFDAVWRVAPDEAMLKLALPKK